MQVNVAGIRRNIKNLAHNYSDAQIKVREATSNDPWGPSATIMAEIADLTYNVVAFSEIMQMIWKRLNDHGKNWRHVYKSLILLEYLIKTGTEKVAQQCKENIFAIQTLREFQYLEEGKDQGLHVREKAKQLVQLLKDDERLKNERTKALKAKERFAQHASGFGSDGSIDGPTHHRETPTWIDNEPRQAPEIEFVRPQTAGEEELQLQLAMAMSREEAEQEEAKRRSDDVRLQLALSQSEQDFKRHQDVKPGSSQNTQQSHLLDLLDINLGAGATASPPGPEPWGMPQPDNRQTQMVTDPWSRTSSPPIDPWQPPLSNRQASNDIGWLASVKSPPVGGTSSVAGWLNDTQTSTSNGNILPSQQQPQPSKSSPWLGAVNKPQAAIPADPWLGGKPAADPWLPTTNNANTNSNLAADPWASNDILGLSSPTAITSPISDLDEFDVITNRSKSAQSTTSPINGSNNNNFSASLLDDMDPLSTKKLNKTPQAFLGENSSLVNLDNLIKPTVPNNIGHPATYNPFSEQTTAIPQRNNMFQQTQPVPSINQLKKQPFPVTLNQDPWAPTSGGNTNNPTQNNNNNNNNNNNTPWMKPEAAASNPFLS